MENNTNKLSEALMHKFISREAITKAELDSVMSRHTTHIDSRIDRLQNNMDHKIDLLQNDTDRKIENLYADVKFHFECARYNRIICTILSVSILLSGIMFICVNFLPKLH
jgi:hypothetical protein